ncbi:MAG TPA: ArsA-related P-loop ATPase [Solirubrobacteraceae bacterium]|nr:ArsA-related P-loop ATPase [Solirubrobacteraceae bacterium]
MGSLLERKLIVVTGKGGVGKSTLAGALGLAAAGRGLRTIVVELGAQRHLPDLFASAHDDGREIELQENLWSATIDPDRALAEWLQALTGRISARLLASSSTFQYFAAAAPGAKELMSMLKLRELCEGRGRTGRAASDSPSGKHGRAAYDLVVLDAPASGHALALLRSPQTFSAIVRVGPLAEQAQQVRQLLEDPSRTGYVAVTHASEMAVTETLELEEGLRRELDRDLDAVIVNGTMPRRFTREELERISAVVEGISAMAGPGHAAKTPKTSPTSTRDAAIADTAAQMARTVNDRARVQLAQIARLRRQRFAEGEPPVVLTVPFAFVPVFDLPAVRRIGDRLAGKI